MHFTPPVPLGIEGGLRRESYLGCNMKPLQELLNMKVEYWNSS